MIRLPSLLTRLAVPEQFKPVALGGPLVVGQFQMETDMVRDGEKKHRFGLSWRRWLKLPPVEVGQGLVTVLSEF